LYISLHIIREIKLKRMRLAGHVTKWESDKYIQDFGWGTSEETD
jgi:hypothetical protein